MLAAVAAGTFYFSAVQVEQEDGAITGLMLTSDAPGTLTVSWDASSPVPTDYRVRWARSSDDYPSWTDDAGNRYPEGTSIELTGLDQGVEYKVQERVRYSDADEPWSGDWADATMVVAGEEEPTPTPTPEPTPVPGAIAGLTAASEGAGSWRFPGKRRLNRIMSPPTTA